MKLNSGLLVNIPCVSNPLINEYFGISVNSYLPNLAMLFGSHYGNWLLKTQYLTDILIKVLWARTSFNNNEKYFNENSQQKKYVETLYYRHSGYDILYYIGTRNFQWFSHLISQLFYCCMIWHYAGTGTNYDDVPRYLKKYFKLQRLVL